MGQGHFRLAGGKDLSEVAAESVMTRSHGHVGRRGPGPFQAKGTECAKAQRQEEAWHRPFLSLNLLCSKVLLSSVVSSCLPLNTAQYAFLKHFCTVGP